MKSKIQLLIAILFASCSTVFAQTQMVTFQVESPASTPVYVFGSWSGWGNYPGNPMSLIAPGKYSITLPIASNTTHEYLFVSGATPANEALNPAWTCTNANAQYTNRVLVLGSADTAVCYTWNTCNTCAVTPPPPPPTPVNVTFQVESPDSLPVSLIGSWNWANYPGAAMSMIAPNKYSVTIQLPPSSPYEFLFVNGATPTNEALNPAWTCTNANAQYTNRVLNLGTTDTALCFTWNTCNPCTVTPPPSNLNVTFRVENPDSTPVYVFGSWNNWSNWPGYPMTFNSTLNVYEAVVPIPGNAPIEYLFVNGVGPTKEVMNYTWPCTNGDSVFTNRKSILGSMDTTLCFVWEECTPCGATPTSLNEFNMQSVELTIGRDFVKINSKDILSFDQLEIFDIVGKKIFSQKENLIANRNIPVQLNLNTLYIFRVKSGNDFIKFKGMIK